MINQLRHLTIKPTHRCTNYCPYCISRRELLNNHSQNVLDIDNWGRVFSEADYLGTEYLDISGGDPALYKDLPSLIWEGKKRGWFVSMNSTGFNIPEIIEDLAKVCLDQVVISLLSLDPRKNNQLRNIKGELNYTLQAIDSINKHHVRSIIHFIINRHNYNELPDLIDFAFENKVNGLALVYPEGDNKAQFLLMNKSEIDDFRENTLPVALNRYLKYRPNEERSINNLKGLFPTNEVDVNFAEGKYWPDMLTVCQKCIQPHRFALIYPDGSVLPCNGIEYIHKPVVGNVIEQSLTEIWENSEFKNFRYERTNFCLYCPVKRHTGIAIRTNDNPPYSADVVKKIPESLPKFRPTVV